MEVTVETGTGGRPRAFCLGDRRLAVAAVLDRWPGAGYAYVKVRADDGGLYILREETAGRHWQVWLYQAPRSDPAARLSGQ
jgi:hypothetical protein